MVWLLAAFTLALAVAVAVLLRLRLARTIRGRLAQPSSGVPGLSSSDPALGNLGDVGKAGSLHEFLVALHAKFGPVASFWWANLEVISVADAALWADLQRLFDRPVSLFESFKPLIGAGSLQYANGQEGRDRRKSYVDSAFSHAAMADLFWAFTYVAERTISTWKSRLQGNASPSLQVKLHSEMLSAALRAITLSSLGAAFEDDAELQEIQEAYNTCWHEMEVRIGGSVCAPGSERERQFKRSLTAMHETVQRIAQGNRDRRSSAASVATAGSTASNSPSTKRRSFIDALMDSNVDASLLSDEIVTFLVGGFHTSGNLLAWALYYIARDREIQDRILRELESVLEPKQVLPTLEQVFSLRYLSQVINETLRCSVLAPWAARESDTTARIGSFDIPPRTPILIALGVVLQSESIFPNSSTFEPERFSEKNRATIPPLAYSPFGFAGKRICPGYRYAHVEAAVIIAALLRTFKFALADSCPRDVKRVYGLVTSPAEELLLEVSLRTPA